LSASNAPIGQAASLASTHTVAAARGRAYDVGIQPQHRMLGHRAGLSFSGTR
jgi:hypothetical protein